MIFEVLSDKYVDLLLQFEFDNREWFESLISSRGDQFYTNEGVKQHIAQCVLDTKLGKSYCGVLIEDGAIIARGNLKDICSESSRCSVGYRVAKNSVGKGYASYCLAQLIELANTSFSINILEAQVLDNNPASKAVLTKLGFKIIGHELDFIELSGVKLGCTTFRYVSA